ncbi:MAG: SdiA-regulated domain-containing protein [Marinifilaceae bacterium]|jgi:uncharacterized protein YjiK|nr:SdiA-regulated domain-containing protein [Marinifilaceae bacterium]
MQNNKLLISLSIVLFLFSCSSKDKKTIVSVESYVFPYNITAPNQQFVMHHDLNEISALTYYKNGKLLCLNDEKGIIYQYNINTAELEHKFKFAKAGDYEGVELVGDTIYAVRSDGKLYRTLYKESIDKVKAKKIRTVFGASNNIEGLGYNPISKSLIFACKENPNIDGTVHNKAVRTAYEYSLNDGLINESPKLIISLDEIKKLKNYNSYTRFSIDLLKTLSPWGGDISFQPSAIAVHPITNNIYVLGSVGKTLLVLDQDSRILSVVKLSRKIFGQPEGICFSPNGIMYISNEAKSRKANILEFKPNL